MKMLFTPRVAKELKKKGHWNDHTMLISNYVHYGLYGKSATSEFIKSISVNLGGNRYRMPDGKVIFFAKPVLDHEKK